MLMLKNKQKKQTVITVMILSFRTDMPRQTVQTQIRSSLIRIYTVCHSVCIVWTHYSMEEPHSSNFRVITTNFLGIPIFRKFTISQTLILIKSSTFLKFVFPSLLWLSKYCKTPKFLDPPKMCCNHPKIWTRWLYHRVMHPKDTDGISLMHIPSAHALNR